MKSSILLSATLGILAGLVGSEAHADQFHYHNVLMGDRAMGMGGAFTAIADDASGLVYNPAGLAFSLSNDISGSANAFYQRTVTYKKAIGTQDFKEKSAGSTAPFFGGLQKVDNMIPGVAAAFGLFNRDSELKDQDDHIPTGVVEGINRFHRTANLRAGTSGYGAAFAKRLISSVSMGVSLVYLKTDELDQTYQDADTITQNEAGAQVRQVLTRNVRQRLTASALEVGLGLQWAMTPKVSLGLNIKVPTMISQVYENGTEETQAQSPDTKTWSYKWGRSITDNYKNENPLGSWPSEYRFGVAYFATTSFVVTSDIIHFTAAKGDLAAYERQALTNFALGAEYYITPPLPVRIGYFTNKDARPKVKEGLSGQDDHVDYAGFTLFFAWVQPNSSISFGGVIQNGSGKAQKLGDSVIQDVSAHSSTVALSATHNF